VKRTILATIAFAGFAVLVTGLLSWLSYRAVHDALTRQFRARLVTVASTLASQVSPEDVADARRVGDEGAGFAHLQVLLEELRATAGVANASVFDSAGIVLYDVRDPSRHRAVTPLAARDPEAYAGARRGAVRLGGPVRENGELLEHAIAPVRDDAGAYAGAVAVEAVVDYLPALADFRRSLLLITGVLVVAMCALGALLVRSAWSSARLEHRLSRAENLAAMGRLTATLAHEIKNPLAIIRGSADRLGKLEPEAERMRGFVIEEVDRLTRTVARYLQFARGSGETPAADGDAGEALRATLDLLEGELRARRIAVERTEGTEAPAPVRIDAESLKQVYVNLILNAAEAMPEGGRLTLSRADRGDRVVVAVADQGPGIAKETLAKLGNPFFSTKAQGTGLGLFLTRRLLESAGGALEIDSAPGRGTTCRVVLPRRKG
jgi:signal transduction histidine kinase